jgi:sigma-B regulation protein RsbU (phosphoserine phosphatase)
MAVSPRRLPTPYFLYAVLAVLFLISTAHRVVTMTEHVQELRYGDELARDPFRIGFPHPELESVEPEAERAGLKPGDQIVRINDQRFGYRGTDLFVPMRAARAGDRLAVDATRVSDSHPSPIAASIVLQPIRTAAPSAIEVTQFAVNNLLTPLVCTVLGFWVAAARPRDIRAWLLLFLLLGTVEFVSANARALYGRQDFLQQISAAYQPILANLWATAMLLFAIYFPERLPLDRRAPWVKWVAIAPVAVILMCETVVFDAVARRDPEAAFGLHTALDPVGPYVRASFLLFVVGFFAIMAYRTFTERKPDARRRLLLLDTGAVVGLFPLSLYFAAIFADRRQLFDEWLTVPIIQLLFAGIVFLFPLTMAYVIVVHRALDVRVVVRQGVQYVLARGGIRLIQLTLLVAIAFAATALLSGGAGIVRIGIVITAVAAILTLAGRFADRLRSWVDRRFFREAYNADLILSDLAMQVRTMVETQPLLQTVAQRVADTLHVPRVAILLNQHGRLQPAYALGYADVSHVVFPEEGATVRRLQRDSHARVRFDDPDSWVHDLSDEERQSLGSLQSDVLLPLSLNQKVLGVLSLGPKLSEEPYSSSDLRVLGSVATQTGLALENSRLTTEITAQIAEREKRQRELEIAREVQERLFPQEYPAVVGLEYAGACRPALEVGGDYYDFVTMSPSELGIAIGDISGKGIPAALLMATLRAFVRGQTISGGRDLAEMMVNLNSLVYESSATNRYATFFFGRYNATTRVLDYVNGGHNPPMLFRASGGETPKVIRLDTGGPVIGLLPVCRYEQGNIVLQPGDALVMYTDGISEAIDARDQEFGEERLAATVAAARTLAPAALITHIMAAADAFVGNVSQYDDMTLVIAKCR